MIPRYSRPEMAKLWTDEHKFKTWLRVELAVCEARFRRGEIPPQDWDQIRKKASFSSRRIAEIEAEVKHDVIAFLTSVAEKVGPASRHIHVGMTSSDVLDTALALALKEASDLLIAGAERLRAAIGHQARLHKFTPCIGRSHGVHAEPTTFGLKLAVWYCEMGRALERLELARRHISVGQISGAVGTCSHLPPSIEEEALALLGLGVDPVSTQVIQRDRHAFLLTTLATVAATIEKITTEIRNLQRTEILEAEEFFDVHQKGSSAMPHKRNPVTAEQMTGLARVVRANSLAALENVALWHERDITHSSVERVILPDSCILLDYMLAKTTQLVEKLLVYPGNMQANIDKTLGLIYSQRVLLALTDSGLVREKAYKIVQESAMRAWREKVDFRELIRKNPEVKRCVPPAKLKECFSQDFYFKSVTHLFQRAGLEE
ncbi:MAG: adenylosuccinate lyase [Candidatus Omnitrophica bacterium]|nr:Adenylosuccinate lyase [bacterium]NUN96672.1 adenylosuccinate lyase [Candidatus Omnitrophota bacterium]